jgi:hypothetical protein
MKKTFSKLFLSFVLASNLIYTTACTLNPSYPMSPEEKTITNNDETDLKFTDVSSEKLAQFNSYISRGMSGASTTAGNTSSIYPSASLAPSVAPSASSYPIPQASSSSSGDSSNSSSGSSYPSSSSSSGYSSSYPSSYYTSAPYYPVPMPTYSAYPMPNSYFYGNFEEYIVTSSQEAKSKGAIGSYLDITKKIVNPILSKLGKDARLISGFGLTDGKGVTQKTDIYPSSIPSTSPSTYSSPSPYYYQPYYNWQFTYVSSSKKEVYSILISSNETLVLKQVWGLKQISTSNIKIDSTDAIKIVKKAVENKNDLRMPAPMPTYRPYYDDPMTEEIYSFQDYFEVSNNLEQYENKVFWNINFSIPYDRQITTGDNGESYSYSSGIATINANTGEIVYLQRITKYKYKYDPCLYPTSAPYPCPTSTPTSYMPPDAITTSASPDVYISPSPEPYISTGPSVVPSTNSTGEIPEKST